MSALTAVGQAPARRIGGTRDRRVLVVVVAAVAVLAFLVRLRLLTHGAGIAASDGYDDGVYYAAADALLHGRLPYRDFLLLHPPGIVVALMPFAAIGALLGDPVGVTVGRLAFIGIGAMNAGLITVIASRHSRVAAAVAGVVAGLSVDVKIWYAVPVVVLGLLSDRRRRFLTGAVAGAAAVALPFLLAAPVAMFREVVLDQLGRPSSAGFRSLVHRLVVIGGDPKALTNGTGAAHAAHLLVPLVLALVGMAAIGAWRVPWARVLVLTAGATVLVLLLSPSFFPHYVGFVAPWMLLVVGIGAGVLAEQVRTRRGRAAVALLPIALLAVASLPADLRTTTTPQPAAALQVAMAGRQGCLVSDDPGLLANAGLLTPMLQRGCPLWPDVTGWTYDRDRVFVGGKAVPRTRNVVWQHDVMRYLTSGTAVVVHRRGTGLSAASRRAIDRLPVIATAGDLVVHAARR